MERRAPHGIVVLYEFLLERPARGIPYVGRQVRATGNEIPAIGAERNRVHA